MPYDYSTINAKAILTKVKNAPDNWFGTTYNMNLYRGCQHDCIYCDSRSKCYQIQNFSEIIVKQNALELLETELSRKKIKGTISFGSMNDPYMPIEKDLNLTGRALQIIAKHSFPIHIITKSNLVLRDIDVLQKISQTYCAISITITTCDDNLSKKIEPNAPTSSKRFEALKQLTNNNIYAGITLMPVLPYITDNSDNIISIIEKAAEANCKYIVFAPGVTLREGQREYFFQKISENLPEFMNIYNQKAANTFQFVANNVNNLTKIFYQKCKEKNIPTKMIFFKNQDNKQLSIF